MAQYCDKFNFYDDADDSFQFWNGLRGPAGADGPPGASGPAGADGAPGATFIPSVSSAGIISWSNNGGLPNPESVNIKGPQGEQGPEGEPGTGLEISGTVATVDDLPSTAEQGTVYNVGASAPYTLYMFQTGTGWISLGTLQGPTGADGTTFTPSVSSAGVISWTNDGGKQNPASVNIKGPTGATGATGTAAGFGTPTATVDSTVGTPSVTVTASGPDTAKVFSFAFSNLKGEPGSGGGSSVSVTQTQTTGTKIASITVDGTATSLFSPSYSMYAIQSSGTMIARFFNGPDFTSIYAPTPPSASTSTPLMDGTATTGTSTKFSRDDHIHPTDTSRAASDLGVTGASTSQYVQITAVDANGKPTAFGAGTPSGGGGTSDYSDLTNKPSIESVTLSGNKTAADLGLAKASDIPTVPSAYTSTPSDLGVASAGTSTSWSKGDHVHKMPSASDVGAYEKPSGGIPASDMTSAVQTSLGKADTAYQKPSGGIPASDLASGVIPTVPTASTSIPLMDGSASAGSSAYWAKGDHVHPTDTSRAVSYLGITNASENQLVKIVSVDANGKPTTFGATTVSGTSVSVTQVQASGAKIATITVDGTSTDIYSPEYTNVNVSRTVTSGTKIASIVIDGVDNDLYTPTIPTASTSTPLMDGTATAGTSTSWSKGDHVHPTDSSRQATITATGILKGAGSGTITTATAGTDYQTPYYTTTLTIATTDWSSNIATKTVNGMTATALVFLEFSDTTTVYTTAQTTDALTFTASAAPSSEVNVKVGWFV